MFSFRQNTGKDFQLQRLIDLVTVPCRTQLLHVKKIRLKEEEEEKEEDEEDYIRLHKKNR